MEQEWSGRASPVHMGQMSPVRPAPIRAGGAMSPVRPHHQVASEMSPSGSFERALPMSSLLHREQPSKQLPFESVVQVYTVSCEPSYLLPWQVSQQSSSTGSGFVVELGGKMYILTNAHVACSKHNTVLRVQKHGSASKFPADAVCVGYDCDLALLRVESEAFWEGLPPVRLAQTLPELYETVQVIGYPVGGQSICITKGVISRVSLQHYTPEAPAGHLVIQIDAAINPGNSGGPAFSDAEEVVGVAFLKSAAGNTDNVGWIIPIPVVKTFLVQFAEHHDYKGMAQLGFRYQKLENCTFRRSMGMGEEQTGILVTEVAVRGRFLPFPARVGVLACTGCRVDWDASMWCVCSGHDTIISSQESACAVGGCGWG
jgi:S1-C subfamily serine protease